MRRKSPQSFRNCVAAFLAEAVATYSIQSCWISTNADDAFVNSFLKDTKIAATAAQIRNQHKLTDAEFETCLDWVMAHSEIIPQFNDESPYDFGLSRFFEVTWKCSGNGDTQLASELVEDYGTMQILGTRFQFGSVSEYHEVKAIVKRIFGINMNDKHVRPKTALG